MPKPEVLAAQLEPVLIEARDHLDRVEVLHGAHQEFALSRPDVQETFNHLRVLLRYPESGEAIRYLQYANRAFLRGLVENSVEFAYLKESF